MSDSPYGHDYPVLDALADWVTATDPFTEPMEPEDITGEMRLALVEATRDLNKAIIDLVPNGTILDNQDLWSTAYKVRAAIRELSMQFLTNEYTDSNIDEPCDVEWNVTGLVMLRDPEYQRPTEIRPAYVGYLIDEGHPDDQEEFAL